MGPDEGVCFVRTDLPDRPRIPACAETITYRLRRTCIVKDGAEIQTPEHLLSCLSGLGLDNLEIEIDGPEVPGIDGSALPFLELVREAGVVELDAPRKQIHLKSPIQVRDGERSLFAVPGEGLRVSYTFEWWSDYGEIDYTNPLFAPQHFSVHVDENSYAEQIAPARTFVASVDAEKLSSMGLGRGATYANTLVVSQDGIAENELRFQDEFARHKILDLIGDLFLLDGELNCQLVAIKTGHSLNMRMVEEIRKQLAGESGRPEQGTPGKGAEDVRKALKTVPSGAAAETPPASEWMDVRQIQNILPHRFPFLLVDRVLEVEDGKRAVGLKNVSINEPYFQGHFPALPVMPGVLQLEAMAQVAGLMLTKQLTEKNKLAMLLSLDNVKLRKAVVPGDQMIIEAIAVRIKSRSGEVKTTATVDGKVVSEAQIRFMIVDPDSL